MSFKCSIWRVAVLLWSREWLQLPLFPASGILSGTTCLVCRKPCVWLSWSHGPLHNIGEYGPHKHARAEERHLFTSLFSSKAHLGADTGLEAVNLLSPPWVLQLWVRWASLKYWGDFAFWKGQGLPGSGWTFCVNSSLRCTNDQLTLMSITHLSHSSMHYLFFSCLSGFLWYT